MQCAWSYVQVQLVLWTLNKICGLLQPLKAVLSFLLQVESMCIHHARLRVHCSLVTGTLQTQPTDS